MTPCTARKHCAQSSLRRASLSNNRKYDTARCLGGGGEPCGEACPDPMQKYKAPLQCSGQDLCFALLCGRGKSWSNAYSPQKYIHFLSEVYIFCFLFLAIALFLLFSRTLMLALSRGTQTGPGDGHALYFPQKSDCLFLVSTGCL